MSDDVTVDLTNYKDRVGQRVAPGRYAVIVDDAELDRASSGNQMINVWLRVNDGGEFDGAVIVDRLVLTERSLFRVVGFMQAIGLPTPKKRVRINLRQFLNQQLEIDVEDGDPYNGRVKSEVRGYNKLASKRGGAAPADLPDLASPQDGDTTGHPGGLDEFAPDGLGDVDEPVSEEVDLDKLDLG